MTHDFSAILFALVVISGLIWLIDAIFFAPARNAQSVQLDETLEGMVKPPFIVDYAKSFFPIFLIVLMLRSFLIEPFRIPSGSMMPTLLIGDFIIVNKFAYGIRLPVINKKVFQVGTPQRGDVVVFRYPEDPSTPFIKRVIGLPGDRISYRDKVLFVNGKQVLNESKGEYQGVGSGAGFTGAQILNEKLDTLEHAILLEDNVQSPVVDDYLIPDGQYFVLGDNRDNSKDSRYWGTVPDDNLIGKAFFIWMNWDSNNGGVDLSRIGNFIQ